MPNKILYFNGCSWAEGAELDSLHEVKNSTYSISEDRASKLLADKIGYEEVNQGSAGKSHDDLITQTMLYAYKNKDNSDNIIINVMLTSPERFLLYCNDKRMVFGWVMVMSGFGPHGSDWDNFRFDEKHAVFDLARLWSAYFHNQDFYLARYFKDIILLNNTLESLGYKFVITNSFYNFNANPDELNHPFYEESTVDSHNFKYSGKSHSWNKSLGHYSLHEEVIRKMSKKNFLFKGSLAMSIKDYLLHMWESEREKYLDVYDRKKLSSVLEGDGTDGYHTKTPNYFFCTNGHPNELGHKRIANLFYSHYKEYEFI
jgi:hypothetical protein